MNLDLVPQSVTDAIASQSIGPIVSEIASLCTTALTDKTALYTLQAIITRLLDPSQKFDDVLDADQCVQISQQLATVAMSLRCSDQKESVQQNAYHVQGLLLWLGTQSLVLILADYRQCEKTFLQNPSQPFRRLSESEHEENQRLISSITQSYSFVIKHVKELNKKVKLFHPQYFIAYQSLFYITGYFAQFNSNYEDAITAYVDALQHSESITTHLPTITATKEERDALCITQDTVDAWYKWINQSVLSTFQEVLKVLLITPMSPNKVKALNKVLLDSRLEAHLPQINQAFLTSMTPLLKFIETTYFTHCSNQIDITTVSLGDMVKKLATMQHFAKFEIIFIAYLFHVPHADIIKCYPLRTRGADQIQEQESENQLTPASLHPHLTSFLQHNIAATSKTISKISFQLLCTEMLYLGPDTINSLVEPILHSMIVSKMLPYTSHINSVTKTVSFYDLKQNLTLQISQKLQSNSQLLKEIDDTYNIAIQQPSM